MQANCDLLMERDMDGLGEEGGREERGARGRGGENERGREREGKGESGAELTLGGIRGAAEENHENDGRAWRACVGNGTLGARVRHTLCMCCLSLLSHTRCNALPFARLRLSPRLTAPGSQPPAQLPYLPFAVVVFWSTPPYRWMYLRKKERTGRTEGTEGTEGKEG